MFFARSARLKAALSAVATGLVLSAANARAADVIKIGAPLALTGALADESKKQEFVWNMWADKLNSAGGIDVNGKKMQVKLIEYDYQSNGQRAGQLAEKLITDDKVDFLLAPFGSGHTKIVATVAERYQTPIVACSSSTESVFDQHLKYLFGTLTPNGATTDTMVKYFKGKMPKLQRLAVLGRNDVFPKAMAEGITAAAKVQGLDVVYDQLYPVGTTDFAAALSAIKSTKPDWIYVTGYTQDLVLSRKQMADLGVNAPIITMITGPAYREFTDALADLANGVSSSTWWTFAANYKGIGVWPTTADFYKEFVAKAGHDPDYIHASCAAAGVVLANAIERAGSINKDKVRDALAATNVMTFYGPIKFSPNGMNASRDIPIIQVQNRSLKVLYPDSIKTGEFQLME